MVPEEEPPVLTGRHHLDLVAGQGLVRNHLGPGEGRIVLHADHPMEYLVGSVGMSKSDSHTRPGAGAVPEPGPSPRVSVVVPIHNALPRAEQSVDSLLACTAAQNRILLLDDNSSDGRVWPRLESYRKLHPQIVAVRQQPNRGFTATINHGCRLAGRDDVVLLNSDTVVTPRWLEKLSSAALSAPEVATVTPLSNAAGAFSVPVRGRDNRLPGQMSPADMAALLESLSRRLYPRVPTGNGFCLYVRRRALDAVGPFDEEAFGQGCGEENDFCMRASQLGFVHLIDDTTYVHHHRSASLGRRKRWLLLRSSWILRRRYPEYRHLVAAWLAADPLDPLRARLQAHLAAEPSATPPAITGRTPD